MSRNFMSIPYYLNILTSNAHRFWRFSTKERNFGYKAVKILPSLTRPNETSIIIYAHTVHSSVQYVKGVVLCQTSKE